MSFCEVTFTILQQHKAHWNKVEKKNWRFVGKPTYRYDPLINCKTNDKDLHKNPFSVLLPSQVSCCFLSFPSAKATILCCALTLYASSPVSMVFIVWLLDNSTFFLVFWAFAFLIFYYVSLLLRVLYRAVTAQYVAITLYTRSTNFTLLVQMFA